MLNQVGRRRAGSWDGSTSRPSSSKDQQHHYNQQQDQRIRSPGVYLRGLPKNTPAEELEELFSEYGVSSVQVVPAPHYSTDIAFVNFHSALAAQQVLSDCADQDLYVGDRAVTIRPKRLPRKQQQQQQQQHETSSTASMGRRETARPPRHSSSSSSGSRVGMTPPAASNGTAADVTDTAAIPTSSMDPCNHAAAAASPIGWHGISSRPSSNHSSRRNSGEWQAAAAAVAAAAASIASPAAAPAAATTPSIALGATVPRSASPATSTGAAAAAVTAAAGQLDAADAMWAPGAVASTAVALGGYDNMWMSQPEEQQPAETAAADGALLELKFVGQGDVQLHQWQQQQQEAEDEALPAAAAAAPLVFPPPLVGPSAAPWPTFSSSTHSTSSSTYPNSNDSRDHEHNGAHVAHLQQPLFDQDLNLNATPPAAAAAGTAAGPSLLSPQLANMYAQPPDSPHEDPSLRQSTPPPAAAAAADHSMPRLQLANMYVQPPDTQGHPSPHAQDLMLPPPVLAPFGMQHVALFGRQHVAPIGMQHVLPFGMQHVLPPLLGFPSMPMQQPLAAPSPIYAAAPPSSVPAAAAAAAAAICTYGDSALPATASAAAYGTPAGYSSAYDADAAFHSRIFSSLQYAGSDSCYSNPHTPWLSTHDEAQHQVQHDAAALCEAVVVFQQLAELQLLHEKLIHCLLCLQEPRSAVLLPCKHLAMCNDCCKRLAAGEAADVCPLCGAQVLDSIEGVMLPT